MCIFVVALQLWMPLIASKSLLRHHAGTLAGSEQFADYLEMNPAALGSAARPRQQVRSAMREVYQGWQAAGSTAFAKYLNCG